MKYKIQYQKDGKIEILRVSTLENLPDNIIKIEENSIVPHLQLKPKNTKEIVEMFGQLSIMLNANLTLSEAIELSLKTKHSKTIEDILTLMKNSITNGIPIDKALDKYQDILGDVPLLFLQLGIENGNIKQSLNSLTQLLQEDMKIKAKLNDTLRYPKLLVGSLILSIGMIFLYVVPNFEHVFTMSKNQIPLSTQVLIGMNDFFKNYFYVALIGFVGLIILCKVIYDKFKFEIHKAVIVHCPILNKVLKNYYFYQLFLLISIIVNSKYQFQLAIENSKNLIPNLYIKKLMEMVIIDIKNGTAISSAFEKTKLFDDLTIKLLFTAEQTTQYETILEDISNYYRQKFQMSLKLFSSYMEPIIILSIALMVLWLMLAIMLPIWNMSSFLS